MFDNLRIAAGRTSFFALKVALEGVARAERAASGAAASAGAVPGRYPISIWAGRPSRPIARRWRKCERSAARSDGCDE